MVIKLVRDLVAISDLALVLASGPSLILGTAGGMFHWRQQQDYPGAVRCSQVSILALSSGLCPAISVLHQLPSQRKASASFSCSSGSAWAATTGTALGEGKAGQQSKDSPVWGPAQSDRAVPRLGHLCSVPAAGTQGWAGNGPNPAPAEPWLQSCTQGVHGARVPLVFCRLWGCRSAQDDVSILLLSLLVLYCNLPGDKSHFSPRRIN